MTHSTYKVAGKTAGELFAGGVQPRDTREKLIHTSMDLFFVRGYHAVSIDEIVDTVGVTKTTFYNYFEGKEDLIISVLKQRDEWEKQAFEKQVLAKSGYDPKAMLLAMFDVLDDWFNHPDYRGCLFILACSEFPDADNLIHQIATDYFVTSAAGIRDIGKSAAIRDLDAFAEEWITLLQGATVYRLGTSDDGAAAIAKRIAAARLETYLNSADG